MNDFIYNKKVGFVAHDAGGAEIISSLIRRTNIPPLVSTNGPASKIFESKIGTYNNYKLKNLIINSDAVICGTGWQSDFEWTAIKLAKLKGIPVVAFLDHWGNYLPRFIRGDELILPTEIWVGDEYAYKIAKSIFHTTLIKLIENPYLLDIKEKLLDFSHPKITSNFLKILYLCEPIQDVAKFGYSETKAMNFFLDILDNHCKSNAEVLVRPHPSESIDKYFWMKNVSKFNLAIDKSENLLEDIARADVVVGRSSMGLVVALTAGKPATTCIPLGGRPCTLPHDDIFDFRIFLDSL